ncbi:MAG TPA: UvrB/UvrC motif-containing protein [Terriglobales bacterium]
MLKETISFACGQTPDFFAQFPAVPAVFLLRGADAAAEPYVGKTASLRRRLQRLLSPAESRSKRLNLRDRVATIEYSLCGSDFESGLLLYKVLRREFPKTYQKRLRLRPAALVRLNLENEYPRAYVTTRLGRLSGKSRYYGPFRSRTVAESFLNDSLDLFKMRRCTFDLNPDPKFPGCVYSEIKMCLAPCFKGCTDDEYAAEVGRVQAYLDTGGQSLITEMEAERERLSAKLDFEAAAQLHAKITKVRSIVSGLDEISCRLDQLDAVIVQPAPIADPNSVALFRFRQGELAGPRLFAVETPGEGQSLEQRVRETLQEFAPAGADSTAQFSEELAILKRWYYRTHKAGEIIVANAEGEISARRITNTVMRIYRGEKAPPTSPRPAEPPRV